MDKSVIPVLVVRTEVFECSRPPDKPGKYLLLCFEWAGNENNRPAFPWWEIKHWDGRDWNRRQYGFDTGGCEQFQPVAWCELPPVSWVQK